MSAGRKGESRGIRSSANVLAALCFAQEDELHHKFCVPCSLSPCSLEPPAHQPLSPLLVCNEFPSKTNEAAPSRLRKPLIAHMQRCQGLGHQAQHDALARANTPGTSYDRYPETVWKVCACVIDECKDASLLRYLTSAQVHAAFTWNFPFLRMGAFAIGLKCTLTAALQQTWTKYLS